MTTPVPSAERLAELADNLNSHPDGIILPPIAIRDIAAALRALGKVRELTLKLEARTEKILADLHRDPNGGLYWLGTCKGDLVATKQCIAELAAILDGKEPPR